MVRKRVSTDYPELVFSSQTVWKVLSFCCKQYVLLLSNQMWKIDFFIFLLPLCCDDCLSLQLPHGPGVSYLQCPVNYWTICRLCHWNSLLDGEWRRQNFPELSMWVNSNHMFILIIIDCFCPLQISSRSNAIYTLFMWLCWGKKQNYMCSYIAAFNFSWVP